MPQINQPSNRISLTNVSLVRYRKARLRFELACYKNKLLEYRSGTETDLDNVLQVPTVFLNVSKGQTASKEDLEKAFGKGKSKEEVIEEILKKGEIQVGEKERGELKERIEREVLDEVARRVVEPSSKRVYTPGMIKKGLEVLSKEAGRGAVREGDLSEKLGRVNLGEGKKRGSDMDTGSGGIGTPTTDGEAEGLGGEGVWGKRHDHRRTKKSDLPIWTGVVTTKSVKSQALDAIRALIAWQPIPVMRARMRLRIACPTSIAKHVAKGKAPATEGENGTTRTEQQGKGTIQDRILALMEQVESQDTVGEEWEVVGFVEPGSFKGLGEFVAQETKGRGRVEVLDAAVTHEDL